MGKCNYLIIFIALFIPSISLNAATITINTGSQQSAISPYIYGTNQQMEGDENLTIMRLGGNRMTGYNWENNASNAGNDYLMSSDDYMCYNVAEYPLTATECANTSGGVLEHFVDYCINHGYKSIITLPMAGYVAADKNGTVSVAETAPSARWDQVIDVKGSVFTYPPNLTDGIVYADEEVWFLVQKYGNASSPNGVMAYELDNEPDMWSGTHPRIHPTPTGAQELVTRGISLATTIKNVDPTAQVFGPVFGDIWDEDAVGSTIDWPAIKSAGGYSWYVDYYLDQLSKASTSAGKRLLDAIDIHYYTESAEGLYPPFSYSTGCRVSNDGCTSTAAALSRMQAPRSLWDPTFIENSSVGQWEQANLPLLPKIQASINQYYPGTKIVVTEHGFGGGIDYSGGICIADVLGIFGKYGVYLATMWKSGYGIYHSAAYKLYRNYNGVNGIYGNTNVQCDSNSVFTMTAYASIVGTDESTLHIIALNKAATAQNATVNITSGMSYTSGEAWAFDSSSPSITARAAPVIAGNSFTYSMPAYSAFHFILHSNSTPTNTPNWTASPTYTRTPTRTGTPSRTATASFTSTNTGTATRTPTASPSRTVTPTPSNTSTGTKTATPTFTVTGTFTPSLTPTFTVSPTFSVSPTVTETMTGTPPTATDTPTITETWTDTDTFTATGTYTITPTFTVTPTETGTYTATQTWTDTPPDTATGTLTCTRTVTSTATATPQYSPTSTCTLTENSKDVINDVLVYPDPLINGPDTLYLRLDTTFQPVSAVMKVYSASFRLIKVVNWDASGITGHYDVSVKVPAFGYLANGTYYYVLTLKDAAGKEARSRASEFIVIR